MADDPGDRRRLILTAVLGGWLLVFGWSIYAVVRSGAADDDAIIGAGRIEIFIVWQIVAGMLGSAAYFISRAWPKGTAVRKIASVPVWLFLAGLAVLVMSIAVAVIEPV